MFHIYRYSADINLIGKSVSDYKLGREHNAVDTTNLDQVWLGSAHLKISYWHTKLGWTCCLNWSEQKTYYALSYNKCPLNSRTVVGLPLSKFKEVVKNKRLFIVYDDACV